MARYISILRGINVGTKRKVLMDDLRKVYASLGCENIVTYIQSGNVAFDSAETALFLEQQLAPAISETFGFEVPVIVRVAAEMHTTCTDNPFLQRPGTDEERLHVTFLQSLPKPQALQKLLSQSFVPDQFEVVGRDLFLFCAGKYSDTKLTNQLIEKTLKVTATTRNWRTTRKLLEMVQAE